jgi:hypothetical protein
VSKAATESGHFHEGVLLKEQPADYYRTTADRYRKLLNAKAARAWPISGTGELLPRNWRPLDATRVAA